MVNGLTKDVSPLARTEVELMREMYLKLKIRWYKEIARRAATTKEEAWELSEEDEEDVLSPKDEDDLYIYLRQVSQLSFFPFTTTNMQYLVGRARRPLLRWR